MYCTDCCGMEELRRNVQSPSEAHRRIRRDHASELAEDYVELVKELIDERGEARSSVIASRLGVANPTVAKALKRLQAEGLIVHRPYQAVLLTSAGIELAQRGRRRHEIVEAFLQWLGVSAAQASIDAEGIEHHVSVETTKAMETCLRRDKAGKKAGRTRI